MDDYVCLGEELNECYYSGFMLVTSIEQNNWLTMANFSNIGGILGLGLNNTKPGFFN